MTNEDIKKYAEEYVATFKDGLPTEESTKYVVNNPVEDKETQEAIMQEVNKITNRVNVQPTEEDKQQEATTKEEAKEG